MSLIELYNSGEDVRGCQIPDKWRESFNQFMFGQTCLGEYKEDGTFEFIYFSSDFRIWYNQNRLLIERDEKINEILK